MNPKTRLLALLLLSALTEARPFAAHAESIRCENIFSPRSNSPSSSVSAATGVSKDKQAFANLEKYEDLFVKARSLRIYKMALGLEFEKSLERVLKLTNGHWFDSGAGHAIAVRQVLEMPEARKLKATVVAYETSAESNGSLKVISGRFLETIADHELPLSDLITDVFGPLAYSSQPHTVMQKYLNNLKENGELYLYLGARHELYGETNQVITAYGEVLTLAQWLEHIPGIEAKLIKTTQNDDGLQYEDWTMKITKVKSHVEVPKLEMIHFVEGAPPTMTFKEAAPLHQQQTMQQLQDRAKANFRLKTQDLTATQFLDAFRSGEISHPLISSIKSLSRNDRWVNFSEVGDQVIQGIKAKNYNFADTSIFVELAQKFIRWRASRIDASKFTYTALADSTVLKNFNDVRLITDYYGDFMSAFAPDLILERYLSALSPKGEIYVYAGKEFGGFGSAATVMTKSGEKLHLRDWIKHIPGLQVKLFRGGYDWTGGEWTFLKIQIKDRKKIKIPQLKLMGVTQGPHGVLIPFFEES